MKAPFAGLLTLSLLNGCSQLPKSYLGEWQGDDRPSLGIMNRLNITDSTISYGNGENINKPVVCKASYTAEEGNIAGQYILKLQNKACDYSRAMNPGHLRDMNAFTIYLSKNTFGTKRPFYDQTDDNKTPFLFIQSESGSTDYRFSRVK